MRDAGVLGSEDPCITHGWSKDTPTDLKELGFGLTWHGAAGVPVLYDMVWGNTSDQQVNRDVLGRLLDALHDTDAILAVLGCGRVGGDTIGRMLGAGLHLVSFASRAPAEVSGAEPMPIAPRSALSLAAVDDDARCPH